MKVKNLKISEIKENPNNPRDISEYMLNVLAKSILCFPRMLEIRPIVVNSEYVALGGNQRLKALGKILEYTDEEISDILSKNKKTHYLQFWKDFKGSESIKVSVADDLDEFQQRDFVVKDNIYYGENDYTKLRLLVNEELYSEWTGVDDSNVAEFDAVINDNFFEDVNLSRIDNIKFMNDNRRIFITPEELDFLCEALTEYKAKNNTNLFFIKWLLNDENKY